MTVKVKVQETKIGGNRPGQVAQTWTTTRGCGKRERHARAQGEVQAEAQTQARAKAQAAVQVQAVRRIQAAVAGGLARRAWGELMVWMQAAGKEAATQLWDIATYYESITPTTLAEAIINRNMPPTPTVLSIWGH